jgi:hypothetical protein
VIKKDRYMLARLLRPSGSALLIAVIAVFGFSTTLHAANRGAIPRSALPGVQPLDAIELREMPGVDVEALMAEDFDRQRSRVPVAPRFAQNIPVAFSTANSGTWETLSDGSRLWRLRVTSPGALSLNLGLERFDLPEGAAFWVHAPDGSGVQGPYTRKNRNGVGGLWTAVVLGDEMVAELQVPKGGNADLRFSSVNHGYRFFGETRESLAAKRGSCNINVVCPQGDPWRDQIRSVARISISGMFLCTAQLVNNTAEDLTPYLLTAQHCIEQSSEAPSVVAYWNYQSPECDDIAGGNLSQNQSGSTFISSWVFEFGSDFTLVELDDQPQPSFNVYYSGWDARDQLPDSTTAIHHPAGDEKSISIDNDPPTVTSLGGSISPGDGRYLRVDDWDEATTEEGSSGGCLFDNATKRCVGTLSGGFAACGNNEPDWYGRLYSHWEGNGTPDSRLSDWLDPLAGDTLFLDGKNGTGAGTEESWLIPAVASLPGVPPTDWKSQVAVVNPTSETRSASVFFVAKGQAWPGEMLSGPHFIDANESLYLPDPLLLENPTSGLLYVTVNGTGTAVSCRTFTPAPGGGTYGQGQPGILLSSASSTTELILPLIHSAPGVFRTNVGFAQTSTGTYQIKVEIYSAAGVLLAQKNYSQAAAWRQINDIFNNMGIGDQVVEGGWIRVTLVSGSPAFWTTYATVIDETTDDPTYVLPVAP